MHSDVEAQAPPVTLLPSTGNSNDLRNRFQSAVVVDMSSLHPTIRSTLAQLLKAPLPPDLADILPDPATSLLEETRRRLSADIPVSLSCLRREANRALAGLQPAAPAWFDVEGFVHQYLALVDDPQSPVPYTRQVFMFNVQRPFPLVRWWDAHRVTCLVCQHHHDQYGGFDGAMRHNEANLCCFADIFCWLSGGWRLPLSEQPQPSRRRNHPSLVWAPSAVVSEMERMFDWGVLYPATPRLVHPLMEVVKEGDIFEQCRLLEAVGHPSPSTRQEDVRLINEHIGRVIEMGVHVPAHLGVLKPVKVRVCLDMRILNNITKPWGFSYAKVHDALALLGRGWYMSKADQERYFNQLPLHPDDHGLLGVFVPPEVHPAEPHRPHGATYASGFAHFGGSSFPAYANAIMAAASALLRARGVPNVFLTDDLFLCGATREACQAHLDEALVFLAGLGFRFNPAKVTAPSQQVRGSHVLSLEYLLGFRNGWPNT
jgi:hypothetical protein